MAVPGSSGSAGAEADCLGEADCAAEPDGERLTRALEEALADAEGGRVGVCDALCGAVALRGEGDPLPVAAGEALRVALLVAVPEAV